jgi:hypothetical protein
MTTAVHTSGRALKLGTVESDQRPRGMRKALLTSLAVVAATSSPHPDMCFPPR